MSTYRVIDMVSLRGARDEMKLNFISNYFEQCQLDEIRMFHET